MAVDVDIIIKGIDSTHKFCLVAHLHTAALVDRTRLVGNNPVVDGTVVNRENIRRLSCLGIDHRPDGAAVAVSVTIVSDDSEVARGEVAHGRLHPRLDTELSVLLGHLCHLDGQTREHPRTVDGHEILHAEAARRRVEIGSIEHVVTQMTHEQPAREIAVERLGHKLVTSYFIHLSLF